MINRIVLHKMSVCDCACLLSGFCILHGYDQGLVVSCSLRPRPNEAETGETVAVSIYPVSQYLRKDGVKRNRVDL